MIDTEDDGPAYCMICQNESERCTCDGVALTTLAHPVDTTQPLNIEMHFDLNPDSMDSIEIEVAERPPGRIVWNYDPLPTPADLCIVAVEIAVAQLGNPEVSSDLNVSSAMAADGWAAELLKRLPEKLYVNRLKVRRDLAPLEWFIECGDGRCVGSNPS